MPNSKVHFDNCYKKFGNGFGKVHKWLDRNAGISYPMIAHRCIDHHLEGIERVREKWGDDAAEAALLHVKDDLDWAGYNRTNIPKDREDSKQIWGDIDDFIEGD